MAGSGRPWLAMAGLGLLANEVQHCSAKHMAGKYWPEKCSQIWPENVRKFSWKNMLESLGRKNVAKFGKKNLGNFDKKIC